MTPWPTPGTQSARLLELFEAAGVGEWVGLPKILRLRIAQFGARILELRRRGYVIENKMEYNPLSQQEESWYRLVSRPTGQQDLFGGRAA